MNEMIVIYAKEALPDIINKSIFLAGPSLRPGQEDEISWRKLALQILSNMSYDGVVFVPEPRELMFDDSHNEPTSYAEQIEWEEQCLNVADIIVFWINRQLPQLMGLTTNDEYGAWKNSGKLVLGCPEEADKVRYQSYYAQKLNIPEFSNIYLTLSYVVNKLGSGVHRKGGLKYIPLEIYNSDIFQKWYNSLISNGNRLDEAKVVHAFRTKKGFMFAFSLWCKVWIESEQRFKDNEFFIGRPDISSCLMYYKPVNSSIMETEIVLVKEYRVPVVNTESFIYELPGGSSSKNNEDTLKTVVDEVYEETGVMLETIRLVEEQSRQLAATILSHHSHLYSVELNKFEMEMIKNKKGQTFGNVEDTELTYVEVIKVKDLYNNNLVDWTNVGMILSVLVNKLEIKF
jgi:nucleoside 2-deoxyribosyltransferase